MEEQPFRPQICCCCFPRSNLIVFNTDEWLCCNKLQRKIRLGIHLSTYHACASLIRRACSLQTNPLRILHFSPARFKIPAHTLLPQNQLTGMLLCEILAAVFCDASDQGIGLRRPSLWRATRNIE